MSTRTMPTRSLHGTSTSAAGLLSGKNDKRPGPEVVGLGRDVSEQAVRGMKVRSSVKKLCDGCRVGRSPSIMKSVCVLRYFTLLYFWFFWGYGG